MSLLAELKRRNVYRVGAAYAIVAWVLVQVASVFVPALNWPDPQGRRCAQVLHADRDPLELAAEQARNHEQHVAYLNLVNLKMTFLNDPRVTTPRFTEALARIRGD